MGSYQYKIFSRASEIPLHWDSLGENEFLNRRYLRAQEIATPANIDYFYVGIFLQDRIVGKSVVQRIRLKGKEVYRNRDNRLREDLINLLNLNMLCVGDIKVTGEHAYAFSAELPLENGIDILQKAIDHIRKTSKREQIPIQLILFKDFYNDSADQVEHMFHGYEKLAVQPNMIFNVRRDWRDFDDYLASLRTKYRTRVKRAFKYGQQIEFREFNLNEIQKYNTTIYQLYLHVLENNKFSVYQLPENYFVAMKQELEENFKLFAGFLDETIVSFYTIIENNQQMEAGFLGYEKVLQKEYQLYLNMLYQMIAYAIHRGFTEIDFSRTALEIKSSVGAEPHVMFGFLKHTHPLMNKMLRSTFRKFYQSEDWVQRNPFKN